MKATNKKGFSKAKLLIILGVFVLVVAISVPIGFGFIREDHPEVDASLPPTEQVYEEKELGIIDHVSPSKDKDFVADDIPTNPENSQTDKEATSSEPTKTPSSNKKPDPIVGKPDILDINTKVENTGKKETAEDVPLNYEEVEAEVIPEPNTPPAPTTPPVQEKPSDKVEDLLPIPDNCSDNLRKAIEKYRALGYGQIKLDDKGKVVSYQTGENTWTAIIEEVPEDEISDELADLFG